MILQINRNALNFFQRFRGRRVRFILDLSKSVGCRGGALKRYCAAVRKGFHDIRIVLKRQDKVSTAGCFSKLHRAGFHRQFQAGTGPGQYSTLFQMTAKFIIGERIRVDLIENFQISGTDIPDGRSRADSKFN